jgi:hypothetical protein
MLSPVILTALVVAQLGGSPSAESSSRVTMGSPAVNAQPNDPAATEQPTVVSLPRVPASGEMSEPAPTTADAVAWSRLPEVSPEGSEYMTRAEVQAEVQKLGWTKGAVRIVPYGTIWGSMSYDSQRAKIGDYCLWIESQTTHFHEPDASVDAKSSRVGIDFFGPCIPCLGDAKLDGKVEVDFQGQFITRNKPGLLLRHAYVEAKDDDFRLLVGQTWDVISPLGIPTLNYTAGSAVGNLAYRRAQFRAERFLAFSDTSMLTLQGSLNANVVTDFVGETNTSADVGPYPDVQARAAITLGQRSGTDVPPIVLGFAGHVGEQDYDFRAAPSDLGVEVPTWSACADLYVPITARLGFQGEFFTGENLSNYMGGILQGVDRLTHRAIHATGGWADIWFKWRPDLCSHFGYALDNPARDDLTNPGSRTYNQMIFSNLLYDATKNLQVGVEVDVWRTLYIGLEPGEAVRIECAVKYMF